MPMSQRDEQKRKMIIRRSGWLKEMPPCDYCHRRLGYQMHELIARSKTVNNPEARELSFQKELCSLLCAECHEHAGEVDVDKALWQFNINLWGRNAVETALARLQAVMHTPVWINE